MGLLCRQLMAVLQSSYPSLYDKTTYRISDISPAHLANVKAGGTLDAHYDRVTLCVEDALKPTSQVPADAIVMAYLIDALPAHLIQVDSGKGSELWVQTEIEDTQLFVDTQVFPFQLKATPHLALDWAQNHTWPPPLAYQAAKTSPTRPASPSAFLSIVQV